MYILNALFDAINLPVAEWHRESQQMVPITFCVFPPLCHRPTLTYKTCIQSREGGKSAFSLWKIFQLLNTYNFSVGMQRWQP